MAENGTEKLSSDPDLDLNEVRRVALERIKLMKEADFREGIERARMEAHEWKADGKHDVFMNGLYMGLIACVRMSLFIAIVYSPEVAKL